METDPILVQPVSTDAKPAMSSVAEAQAEMCDVIFKDIDAIMERVEKKLAVQQQSMDALLRRLNRRAA